MTAAPPPPGTARGPAPPPSGSSALSGGRLFIAFGAVFLVIVTIAALAIVVLAPRTPPPECQPGQACGGPPASPPPVIGEMTLAPSAEAPTPPAASAPPAPTATPADETPTPAVGPTVVPSPPAGASPSPGTSPPGATASPSATEQPIGSLPQPAEGDPSSPALRSWPVHDDATWGYAIHHPPFVTPEVASDGAVVLAAGIAAQGVEVHIKIDGAAASVTPQQLHDQLLDRYRGRISSLSRDDGPLLRVHRPSIGQVPATFSSYRGDLGNAGSITPVALIVMAATDGRVTVGVSVIVVNPETVLPGTPLRWFRASGEVVDPVLKRFEWPVQ